MNVHEIDKLSKPRKVMFTDLNMKDKTFCLTDDMRVVDISQMEKLKTEIAYWMGKGEFSFELCEMIHELINDYKKLYICIDIAKKSRMQFKIN